MESSNIDNSNRLVLLFVLGVVLYLLYRYQHYVINITTTANPVTTPTTPVVTSALTLSTPPILTPLPTSSIIPIKLDSETTSSKSTRDNELSYQQDSMVNSLDSIYQDTISFNSMIDGGKKDEIENNSQISAFS